MSSYAHQSSSGGSSYSQKGNSGGSPYAGGSGGGKASKPKQKSSHGFFHRFGSDIYNAAVNSPAGIYDIVNTEQHLLRKTIAHPNADPNDPRYGVNAGKWGKHSHDLVHGYLNQLNEERKHPLRHPGNTFLDALPVLGVVGKAAEAGALAKSGASAGEVARAAAGRAQPGVRSVKVGDLEVRGHYSRAAGSRVAQKLTDAALQKGADKSVGVSVGGREISAEKALHARAQKWMGRNERVNDARARAAGTRLQKVGEKLEPHELRALRLVAEEVPVDRRLAAQQLRQAGAKHPKEVARHQERIDLTKAAMEHLTAGPDGKPVFKPEAAKLRKVYTALEQASGERGAMLHNLGLMDEAAQQAAKVKVGRVAAGATLGETVAPASTGADVGASVRVVGQKTVGKIAHVNGNGDVTVFYPRFNRSMTLPLARLETVGAPALKGAEDITVSPGAPFIGNPVERTKVGGAPKLSSTGTFGHTRKPASLKAATGGAVEHALERNDVTNIVAERHAEAVRLSKIDRVRKQLAKAGAAVPRRHNDVFVWTDNLTKNERIPAEVRKYLDNPESVAQLPDGEQVSLREKLRQSVFEQHDWHGDPETRQKFEQIAAEGKGVFVPRKLAGEYAKREVSLPGSGFIDAVNNAQKAGLVYLKVNYPVIQGVSNTAMNMIHQGFAAPVRLTQAVKLDRAIGPDLAAVVDDIMGQGAVRQAAFAGRGTVARASQKLADTMSSKVDRPSRRAAFLHEAHKAGYGTATKLEQLLTDDSKVGDLAEVAQRAKEAIVDYEELGPNERAIVRRLVFVYPWQKGATKYASHFLRDHPVQAAALGHLGQEGAQTNGDLLGPVSSYLDGAFTAGGGLVNPSGVNFFQTPAQIAHAIIGTASGDPSQIGAGLGFLSPFPGITAGLLSGRDDIGRPLKGNVATKLRDLTVGQTPASSLLYALTGGKSHPVFGGRGPSKTFPNANDPLWRFFLGGMYPRKYSKPALNKNAALQKSGR